MGAIRNRRHKTGKNGSQCRNKKTEEVSKITPICSPDEHLLVRIALDAWRIDSRLRKFNDPLTAVISARSSTERLFDDLNSAGLQIKDYVGHPYDENLIVNVVDDLGSSSKKVVIECLEPAVIFEGELKHTASVIIGDEAEYEANS